LADWLNLAPHGGPAPVQKAREAAQALADQLPADRAAIDDAKRDLVEAERRDREQLAASMRRGDDPISDTQAVDAARAAVGVAERRHQARRLAIETAQQEFGDAIAASRDEWRRSAERGVERAHTRATKALDQLEGALDELGQARAVAWWLTPERGYDKAEGVPPVGILADARSSAAVMANNSPASRASLMAWCREVIGDPPEAEARQSPPGVRVGA
jgi:hypothetical protein